MRTRPRSSQLFLGLLLAFGSLQAQQPPPLEFALGGGLLFADAGHSSYLRSRGTVAFLRISASRLPVILDASMQYVPASEIIFSCPPFGPCGPNFAGPTTVLTLTPALQGTLRVPPGSWLFHLGPSVHWLLDRQSGSNAIAAGLRTGIGFHAGQRRSGLLISADYIRLFRGGTAPDWFLPITIGWQF